MKHGPPATENALAGYVLPSMSPAAERMLILAFAVFIGFTTMEAPLRYGFTLVGAPWRIYFRDVAMVLAMLVLACQQILRHQLQTAFIVFALLIVFHGTTSFLMCGV